MSIYASEVFLCNKYSRWYHNIIAKSQSENRCKSEAYYEKHHIIPKSFFENVDESNIPSNLVLLTAREHYICHLLLTKMCIARDHTNKMIFAFHRFCWGNESQRNQVKYNSKSYETLMKSHAKIMSERFSGKNHPLYGTSRSQETKDKISKCKLGKKASEKQVQKISKYWEIIDPTGRKFIIKNLEKFCRENNLLCNRMREVSKGYWKQHRGYSCNKLDKNKNPIISNIKEKTLKNKKWIVIDPKGNSLCVINMKKFCESRGLNPSKMIMVSDGKAKSHKKYTCERLN